jgi:hypothetical protein
MANFGDVQIVHVAVMAFHHLGTSNLVEIFPPACGLRRRPSATIVACAGYQKATSARKIRRRAPSGPGRNIPPPFLV